MSKLHGEHEHRAEKRQPQLLASRRINSETYNKLLHNRRNRPIGVL